MTRLLKQLLYGILFAAIIAVIVWPAYRLFVPSPSCMDGIQNQGEEGVDCGAVCGVSCPPALEPLSVAPVMLLTNSDGSFDAVVLLDNPNAIYGAARIDYRLDVFGDDGGTLATRRGTSYANPLQPRYLVFPLGTLGALPANASLTFDADEVEWQTLSVDAAGETEFAVRNDVLIPQENALRYQATVINRSRFDFDTVDIVILLEDSAGAVIGAGSTSVRTVLANEERGFVVDWPFEVSGVARARAYVGTNLFSNDNYILEYGTQGRVPGF
jgi:hypothetical protein